MDQVTQARAKKFDVPLVAMDMHLKSLMWCRHEKQYVATYVGKSEIKKIDVNMSITYD